MLNHELSTMIDQAGGMRNLGSPMPVMEQQIVERLKEMSLGGSKYVRVAGKHHVAHYDFYLDQLFLEPINRVSRGDFRTVQMEGVTA